MKKDNLQTYCNKSKTVTGDIYKLIHCGIVWCVYVCMFAKFYKSKTEALEFYDLKQQCHKCFVFNLLLLSSMVLEFINNLFKQGDREQSILIVFIYQPKKNKTIKQKVNKINGFSHKIFGNKFNQQE